MKKGFTLIELLIVIALLGTLAVALLAAIDPFEQFRKGSDTGTRNATQEIFNAGIRYYSLKHAWPATWAGILQTAEAIDGEVLTPEDIITPLVDAGELKDNFIELSGDNLQNIYISSRAVPADVLTDSHIAVCFKPESKSFQSADPNTKFTTGGWLNATSLQPIADDPEAETPICKVNGGAADCYWCIY